MNWLEVELNQVMHIRKGSSYPFKHPDRDYELFSIPGYDSGKPEICKGSKIKSNKTKVKPGDILFSKLNPHIPRVWIVDSSKYRYQISSTEFWPLVYNRDLIEKRFIRHLLLWQGFRDRFSNGTEAATKSRSRIKPFQLLNQKIFLPTKLEQHRIIDILDQAEALSKKRVEVEDKSALILPTLFYKMFGDPITNPMEWEIMQLGDACERITDGTHQPPPFVEEGIPFLFVQNIVKGHINFETHKFITQQTYENLTKNIKPQKNDILYSTVGSYGVAVVVDTDKLFLFQRHIGHIRPKKELLNSWFLSTQLNTPFVKAQADQRARGLAQKTLNLSEIRQFKIIVPPLNNQIEFGKFLKKYNKIKTQMNNQNILVDNIFKIILHNAFKGNLTAKWREGHMNELLKEMEHQSKMLNI